MGPGPGQTPCGPLAPTLDRPPCGGGVASLCPLCPPTPAASLCTEQFLKWKLRHNIHRTGTHTHAHGRLPPTGAGRQLHSESTTECIQGPALVLTVCSSSPPTALLAARGRAVQGWGGKGSASLQVPQGQGGRSRSPGLGGGLGKTPGLRYLRGKNAWALPLEERQGPRVGSGAGPTALACQPGLNTHLVNLGARREWTPSQPHSWEPGLPPGPPHSGARPGLGRRGEQGLP